MPNYDVSADLMVREFANDSEDRSSIPDRVISKIRK